VAAAERDLLSANTIMPSCQTALGQNWDNPFAGYRLGSVDGLAAAANIPESFLQPWAKQSVCLDIPNGVTGFQMVKVVVAYIDARPARMHENFQTLALEALRNAWPCK
jgi:hypothetical protein